MADDVPPAVRDRLASTVTTMDRRRFAEALRELMRLMDDEHGPVLAASAAAVYPVSGAAGVRRLVEAVLASP